MDKKTYLGLALIGVILIVSSYFITPKSTPQEEVISKTETLVNTNTVVEPKKALSHALLSAPFGNLLEGTEQFFVIENEDIKATLSTKGAKIYSVVLKKFKDYKGDSVLLFDGTNNSFGFQLDFANHKSISTNDLYFSVVEQNLTEGKIKFLAQTKDQQWLSFSYSLPKNSLKLGFEVKSQGLTDILDDQQKHLELDWSANLRQQEKDINYERQYSSLYYKEIDGDVDWLSEGSDDDDELNEARIEWISFKQRFFSSVLIPKSGFDKATIEVTNAKNNDILRHYKAQLYLPYDNKKDTNYEMEFIFANNKFQVLQDQGHDLEQQVRLGWLFLKWINRIAVIPVFNLLEGMDLNYGIIILILTVLLKLILSPLTYKSYLSMAKMRILKPEIDEVKEKVGSDNPMLLQQEQMKIYKQAGVNPLGGCIPMLLQLPITIAFFYFFPNLFELRGQSFLWMNDLSTYDAVITFPKIPLLGWEHLSVMCLLMTVSTLIYTYYNNEISGVSGEMKYIGYITPIIFLGMLNSFPAGLNFYYFCANMLTFGQQYFIKKFVDEDKIHAQIQENKKKGPEEKKKPGFQARMESYMREQQKKTPKK